jgi:hypothetical protein
MSSTCTTLARLVSGVPGLWTSAREGSVIGWCCHSWPVAGFSVKWGFEPL